MTIQTDMICHTCSTYGILAEGPTPNRRSTVHLPCDQRLRMPCPTRNKRAPYHTGLLHVELAPVVSEATSTGEGPCRHSVGHTTRTISPLQPPSTPTSVLTPSFPR